MEFHVHWLSLTLWADKEYALKLWEEWFQQYLGPLVAVGHGGRGFKGLYQALGAAKLYADPVGEGAYVHLEFPGSACDALPPKLIQEFIVSLNRWEKFRVSRLDLAWDGVGFTPQHVVEAVSEEKLRSLLKRKTLHVHDQPFEEREDGVLGTSSVRLGSNQSSRMLRVYDKRGPVRLEFQTRAERADLVARDVLLRLPQTWAEAALAHLRDYVDFEFEGKLLAWWEQFVREIGRAFKKISDARQLELSRMTAWVMNQVAPTLSVLADVLGEDIYTAITVQGRRKRGKRYEAVLAGAGGSDASYS
ncbi:MAG: replication initiation factor domain-containing protein [Anaerolineales bacterium]|nr:replication initiation factor domain-containing protein [Anaerolineales bacterium]